MKINLAFRGGAAKLPAYLRFMKELGAKGGLTEGRISGASAGGITAAAIACRYSAAQFKDRLEGMPGQNVMAWENKMEKGNIFQKVWYGLGTLIAGTATLTEQLQKYFFKNFSWSMVPPTVDLYIAFTLQSELASATGFKHGFSFLDIYKLMTEKGDKVAEFAKEIFVYYGAKDGVYVFCQTTKRLNKISDDVIPLHLLVFGTMANPVFNDLDLTIDGQVQQPFDGGIADNFAVCAQQGPFVQIACIDISEDVPDGSLSDFYRQLGPKPDKIIYCPPVVKGKSFFDFRKSAIEVEWAVPATNVL